MIRICGEKVSCRLSRRLQIQTLTSSSFEKKDLFSRWMERANKRIQKIVFCFSPKVSSLVLIPSFPQQDPADVLDQTSAVQKKYEDITLWIGAIFSLFVSIFYQSSEDPASKLRARVCIRDEREGGYSPLLSSLLFFGLIQKVEFYLQSRIFVMEKSYV